MHSRVPGPPWRLPWCTSRASWRRGRAWWGSRWRAQGRGPASPGCSSRSPRSPGVQYWLSEYHHHGSHNRHHRRRHHDQQQKHDDDLVTKQVIMHQVRGIGMMQYITKMMKTKYLNMIQMIQKQWFSIKYKACFLGVCIIWLLWRNDDGNTKPWRPCTSDYYCTSSYYIILLYYYNYYHYHYYQTMASMYICSRASWTLASIV